MSGVYLHWGVIQISLANFAIIVAMLVVFGLAIAVPMRASRHGHGGEDGS